MADRDSNRIKKRVKTDVGSDVRCEQWNSLHLFSQSCFFFLFMKMLMFTLLLLRY